MTPYQYKSSNEFAKTILSSPRNHGALWEQRKSYTSTVHKLFYMFIGISCCKIDIDICFRKLIYQTGPLN